MKFLDNNRAIVFTLIALVISGLAIPFLVISVTGSLGHSAGYIGQPIAETSFAALASSEADPVMLPGGHIDSSQESVRMRVDYDDLEALNLSEATDAAVQFMSHISYLSNVSTTLDTGWVRLESAKWVLRFLAPDLYIYISVNAISGKVMSFVPRWQGPSPNPYVRDQNESRYIGLDEIEGYALEFFEFNNYTLSEHSLLSGPSVEYGQFLSRYVYSFRFFHVVNQTRVWGNVVSLHLDVETGEVVSFIYQWTHVPSIPIERIITRASAEKAAVSHVGDSTNITDFRVIFTELVFVNMALTSEFRLCWVVSIDHPTVAAVAIDAVSGDTLTEWIYVLSSSFVEVTEVGLDKFVWAFITAIAVAFVVYLGVKKVA